NRTWLADDPLVAHVAPAAAVQADDAVAVRGPVELRAPADAVPVAEDLRAEGHLDTAVRGRADVLQDARAAVDPRQLSVQEQVARRSPIHVHRARHAALPRRELQTHDRLRGVLPRTTGVH